MREILHPLLVWRSRPSTLKTLCLRSHSHHDLWRFHLSAQFWLIWLLNRNKTCYRDLVLPSGSKASTSHHYYRLCHFFSATDITRIDDATTIELTLNEPEHSREMSVIAWKPKWESKMINPDAKTTKTLIPKLLTLAMNGSFFPRFFFFYLAEQ